MSGRVNIFYDANGLTVYNADVLDALPTLEPGSVDAVVTSPPYAMQRASTYGGVPEKDYPDWTVAWMEALRPVLKPDASVIINIRPHVKDGQIRDYTLRTRLALRDAGWAECEELIWIKKSAPPTGSPRRPRRSWESLHWFAQHGKPWSDAKANGAPMSEITLARPWNIKKTTRAAKNGWSHDPGGSASFGTVARQRDWVEINVGRPSRRDSEVVNHPAPFPWQLAEWCAKLICPPGGTVLDPFAGSGSTAVAALRNGFQSVAIEREPEYAQMIVDRYKAELANRDEGLFDAA